MESGRDDAPGLALLDHAGDLVLHHHDLGGLEQDDRDGLNRAAVVCDEVSAGVDSSGWAHPAEDRVIEVGDAAGHVGDE